MTLKIPFKILKLVGIRLAQDGMTRSSQTPATQELETWKEEHSSEPTTKEELLL